ncbi:hypothetical protein ED236_00305 [Pseudomethylobacillus aquaticus]|uniref:Uncharacterized protein n=1 Tax=Pseudomethylobacillus aquaticus TaxID=2676064 RepID=A0A3N0V582_9PROT|nr:hypothetical protein [Pseudomethylobacillus aquaticus]ROH87970.1 hypothetical protein ED236_00305 [Pseudomethylobacillus aquaticus]
MAILRPRADWRPVEAELPSDPSDLLVALLAKEKAADDWAWYVARGIRILNHFEQHVIPQDKKQPRRLRAA